MVFGEISVFYKKEDPYLNSALSRLSTIYTLIQTQAQHHQNSDSHFYLDAFADLLDKTILRLPRLFSLIDNYEKEKLSEGWFFVQYDLIRYDDTYKVKSPFSVTTLDTFYKDYRRFRDYYVQSPHAIILYQNNLYHYNCSVEPHTLTLLHCPESASIQQKSYLNLKAKLNVSIKNIVYHAKEEERKWVAAWIEVLPRPARPITLNLVQGFLAQAGILAAEMSHDWQQTKKQFLIYSLLGGIGAFTVLILQSAVQLGLQHALTGSVISTATMIMAVKIALIFAAIIVIVGFSFALYAYFQERACDRLAEDLGKINYKNPEQSVSRRPASFSYIEQPLATFFQTHRATLESAFTPDNFVRAGISG